MIRLRDLALKHYRDCGNRRHKYETLFDKQEHERDRKGRNKIDAK